METNVRVLIYVLIIGVFLFEMWLDHLNYTNRNAEIPEEVNDIYEKEKYQEWLQYTMENHRFSNIVSMVSTAVFVLLLALGGFSLIEEWSKSITSNSYLQVLVFLGIYYLVNFVIGLPFSYYRTFSIEQRYGFNKTTKKIFVVDKIKSILLTFVLGGLLVWGLNVLYDKAGNLFYILAWAAIILIFIVVQMIYVRVIIPIFNKLTPLEDGELKDMINEFASSVGYEVKKIRVIDASKRSTKLNAFFVGFGRFKQVVLYDTLIEKMSNEEIVSVLAHEIGHNKHKHILYNMLLTAINLSIYIGVMVWVFNTTEFSTAFGVDTALHFGFGLILVSVLLSPISILIGIPMSYLSRKFEFQADNYAALHYNKESMVGALKVLSKENFSNLTPHPLYVKLLYSHPPVAQRIRKINEV
jgi:STE24 endopeptidase